MVQSARTTFNRPIHTEISPELTAPGIRRFGEKGMHTFFGYYDLTPFDLNEQRLLATSVGPVKKATLSDTKLKVGFFDLRDASAYFHEIDMTTTWCWQQGCRLQWFPDKTGNTVIYNRVVDNRYGCVVQDIQTKKLLGVFNRPIYAIDAKGRWGLSLNFSRLQRLRPGYGYSNFPDTTEDQKAPENDGVWKVDLETGQEEFLISIKDVSELEPLPSMEGATHNFNHLHFNPAASRFLMFHNWTQNGRRYARLMTADLDGGNIYPLINEELVAHYAWKSDQELVAVTIRPDTGAQYDFYRDQSRERTLFRKDLFNLDGHPSFSPDGSLVLTDTYPDKERYQHLLLYKMDTGVFEELGSFFCPPKYFGDRKCDLHPRWSPLGNAICIDSAHDSMRALYVLDRPRTIS